MKLTEEQRKVNELFNMVQNCRCELTIMRGNGKTYDIDNDLVKVCAALAREAEFVQKHFRGK